MDYIRNRTLKILNDLMKTVSKSNKSIQNTIQHISNTQLKNVFKDLLQERIKQSLKLKSEILRLGGKVDESSENFDFNLDSSKINNDELIKYFIQENELVSKQYQSALHEDILWEVIPVISKQFFKTKELNSKFNSFRTNSNLTFQNNSVEQFSLN